MDPKRELAALSERAAALGATIERLRDELEAIHSEERALRTQLGMFDEVAELERAAARITPFDSEPTDNKTVVDAHMRSEPANPLPPPPRAPHASTASLSPVSQAMLLRAGVIGAALTVGLAIVALLAADLLVRRQREPEPAKAATAAPTTSAVIPARVDPAPPPSPPSPSAPPPPRDPIPEPPPPAAASLEAPPPPPPSLSSAVVPIVPRPVVSSGLSSSPSRSSGSPRDYGF